jgi:hypothetical protein
MKKILKKGIKGLNKALKIEDSLRKHFTALKR